MISVRLHTDPWAYERFIKRAVLVARRLAFCISNLVIRIKLPSWYSSGTTSPKFIISATLKARHQRSSSVTLSLHSIPSHMLTNFKEDLYGTPKDKDLPNPLTGSLFLLEHTQTPSPAPKYDIDETGVVLKGILQFNRD